MADVNAILAAFRADLVLAGLARRPIEPANGAPPMLVEPLEGAAGPSSSDEDLEDAFGEGTLGDRELVVTLMHSSDAPPASGYDQAAGRTAIVDVVYRSRTAAALRRAYALDDAIGARLVRPETNYGYGFILAPGTGEALLLQAAQVFSGIGPVSRSRAEGFRHVAKYAITTSR